MFHKIFHRTYSIRHTYLPNKSFIHIKGKDCSKFLNGLITSRTMPSFVMKNLTTIVDAQDECEIDGKIIKKGLPELDVNKHYGIIHEDRYNGNLTLEWSGIYSMFLNSKGKVVSDCYIYPAGTPSEKPEFYIEVESCIRDKLLKMLNLYKLASKVKIQPVDDIKSWYVWGNYVEELHPEENPECKTMEAAVKGRNVLLDQESVLAMAYDTRYETAGTAVKVVTKAVDDIASILPVQSQLVDASELNITRYLAGVPDGTEIKEGGLPLEYNLDLMGGVAFDKGCYVGQELTVRMWSTGMLQKRVVPVRFVLQEHATDQVSLMHDPLDPVTEFDTNAWTSTEISKDRADEQDTEQVVNPFGAAVKKRKVSAGQVVAVKDNIGLANMRLSDLLAPGDFYLSNNKNVIVVPFLPNWWPEDVFE